MKDCTTVEGRLRIEVEALQAETARLLRELESQGLRSMAAEEERDEARAHVAALVQALRLAIDTLERDAGGYTPKFWREVKAPLDAPDLAALVAREQAREAVIAAARTLNAQLERAVPSVRDTPLQNALRALDAAEKGQP